MVFDKTYKSGDYFSKDLNNNESSVDATDSSNQLIQIQTQPNSESDRINAKIKEFEDGFEYGIYEHKAKTSGHDGKPIRASCWKNIHEIFEINGDKPIANFFYCTLCKGIIHNPYKNGNTNKLNRHGCIKKQRAPITHEDKANLKFAASKFVAVDSRSYNLVEGPGFKRGKL